MKCRICKSPYHEATGHILSENFVLCGRCAKDFCLWYKRRMGQMHAKLKNKLTGKRMEESFADNAARSIIAD